MPARYQHLCMDSFAAVNLTPLSAPSEELLLQESKPTRRRPEINSCEAGWTTGRSDHVVRVVVLLGAQHDRLHQPVRRLISVVCRYLVDPHDFEKSHIASPPFRR